MTYLTDDDGAITKTYEYDAFGNEENPVATDTNPFRYAGEYYDKETGTYYLRARYYDPVIGRFTQEDPHWNQSNMLYGDDPLKLNNYNYAPSLAAIIQSGNLYVYAMSNPTRYTDPDGEGIILAWITSKVGEAVVNTAVDALATGLAYYANGKSFMDGFFAGASSSFGSNATEALLSMFFPKLGATSVKIISSTIASVVTTICESNGALNDKNLIKAVINGLISATSSLYFDEIGNFSKDNDLLTKLAPEFDESTSIATKYFLQGSLTATRAKEVR